jgi:hypothetical protein
LVLTIRVLHLLEAPWRNAAYPSNSFQCAAKADICTRKLAVRAQLIERRVHYLYYTAGLKLAQLPNCQTPVLNARGQFRGLLDLNTQWRLRRQRRRRRRRQQQQQQQQQQQWGCRQDKNSGPEAASLTAAHITCVAEAAARPARGHTSAPTT